MQDLTEHIAQQDAQWQAANPAERHAIREAYVAAGWRICPHPDCPPYDCQGPAPLVHYRTGFKSGAGYPVMYTLQYGSETDARKAAIGHIDQGHGMHYVWKVTTEEVPL